MDIEYVNAMLRRSINERRANCEKSECDCDCIDCGMCPSVKTEDGFSE